MAILNDIFKGVKTVSKKAGETIDIAKMSVNVSDEKRKIETLKKALGDVVYEKYRLGLCTNDSAVAICKKIDESNETIKNLQKEIDKYKK